MYRYLKRFCGLVLFGVFSLVSVLGAFAEGMTPRYSYIDFISAGVHISGNTVEYSGTAAPIYNEHRAKITVTLQKRLIEGGAWSNVTSKVHYGGYASFAGCGGTYRVDTDYEYRTYTRCTIYDSNDIALETRSCYSNIARP